MSSSSYRIIPDEIENMTLAPYGALNIKSCGKYCSYSVDMYGVFCFVQRPKLKTGYRYETSFRTRVSRMGLGSFVDINISVMKYYFI